MSRVRLLALLLASTLVLGPPAAASGTSGVVVSQVFGGGGNAGAPFVSDFVELFNRGSNAVDVTGWTIQYATAAGTTWQATPLAGTIQPGRYYLVALAAGTAGNALPTPDASGTTNLSATSGKVALVRDAAPLACGATAGSCGANPLVEDLLGFGAASDYEGSAAAPALSSTTAALRGGDGCVDTDANSGDFSAASPAPRNSGSTPHTCTVAPAPPPPPTASQEATVDVDVEPVLSLSLERSALSFGKATAGGTPAPVSQHVTVLSNHAMGYALSVQRSAFAPVDLPLAIQAAAPAGAQLGAALGGGGFVAVPIGPSALTIGTTSSTSAGSGDVWPTNVGFAAPLATVAPGRYTATLTFTVIGR